MRKAQVEKRQRKLIGMADEMSGPQRYGPDDAEVTFVCWGSTYGPLREAVDRLNHALSGVEGAERPGQANLLHFVHLWPFPVEAATAAFEQARRLVAVEVNATGQLATLIRSQTGRQMDSTILKYDGRAFTPEYITSFEL